MNDKNSGYCDAGIHYIGDSDECWRCEVWQRRQLKSHLYYGSVDAHLLRRYMEQ